MLGPKLEVRARKRGDWTASPMWQGEVWELMENGERLVFRCPLYARTREKARRWARWWAYGYYAGKREQTMAEQE